jgi:hypothetical protein
MSAFVVIASIHLGYVLAGTSAGAWSRTRPHLSRSQQAMVSRTDQVLRITTVRRVDTYAATPVTTGAPGWTKCSRFTDARTVRDTRPWRPVRITKTAGRGEGPVRSRPHPRNTLFEAPAHPAHS